MKCIAQPIELEAVSWQSMRRECLHEAKQIHKQAHMINRALYEFSQYSFVKCITSACWAIYGFLYQLLFTHRTTAPRNGDHFLGRTAEPGTANQCTLRRLYVHMKEWNGYQTGRNILPSIYQSLHFGSLSCAYYTCKYTYLLWTVHLLECIYCHGNEMLKERVGNETRWS